jgi:transposase InsO family protein
MLFVILLFSLFIRVRLWIHQKPSKQSLFKRKAITKNKGSSASPIRYSKPKPPWVKTEIIHLKALMPDDGCRKIADNFNRRNRCTRRMTVSKSYVAKVIREHRYDIRVLRNKIKHAPPKVVPRQLIWGVDLSFKTDSRRETHPILGIVEHHSRKNLALAALKDKTTLTLLRHLLNTIEIYGKPKIIRTDNEAVFTAGLFKLVLWLLNIRHQTIDPHCPWQNGRIERFFGTLKQKLNRWPVGSLEQLNQDLAIFRFWYNKVRTHNNLNGRTPDEVWREPDICNRISDEVFYFNEWDGLLTGFYDPT